MPVAEIWRLTVNVLLRGQGCNPSCVNREGQPALHVAVLAAHADVVPVLVQGGADVNRKGPNHGNTALHEAVSTSTVDGDVIDALLGWDSTTSVEFAID